MDSPYRPPASSFEAFGKTFDMPPPEPSTGRRIVLPAVLYVVTWATTLSLGLVYGVAVMLILTAHELGHFFQARRYGVPTSLPYFLPMPFPPIGTMGAVIAMKSLVADRKALFDIAITGPLAGLVPSLICCVAGIRLSTIASTESLRGSGTELGAPLLFQWLSDWLVGPVSEGQTLVLHDLAYAGWVGLFITALNLIPIGQLDGGHLLYALLKRKAHPVATLLFLGAIAGAVIGKLWFWSLMLLVIGLIGPRHPPTADDNAPLGAVRIVLGWLMILFVVIGFTPSPFLID